jgi:hypothetical protein
MRANGCVNDTCSEQTATLTCVEVKEQIYQHIRDNRKLGTDEISSEMSTDHG